MKQKALKEQWTCWEPIEGLAKEYYMDDVFDYRNKLDILLDERDSKNKIRISFDTSVYVYRYTNESFRFGIRIDLCGQHGELFSVGMFFKSKNSDYLLSLTRKASKSIQKESLIHFLIITPEEVIDIVADREPIVEFIE